MRIGIIRMRYTPYGGAETFLKRFMAELVNRGHSIDLFSTGWEEMSGIVLHRIKTFGPSFLRPLVFASNVEKAVSEVNPQVVVSLERTYSQDIYRAGDGVHREWLQRRIKTVPWHKGILISLNPLHKVLLYLEKRLFSSGRLKKVVANSRRVKEEIMRHYGLPEEKICVIYNGINFHDLERIDRASERKRTRESLGISGNDTVLLFVGSGFERKGLIYLIRALGILKEADNSVKLLVVGRGKEGRYRTEGLGDRVIFTGAVKDTSMFYAAADIFCLPSIYEPFSNACLEAMAFGLPVVTSRANGASEILTEPANGAVIEDPCNPAEIAGKIKLFLDPEKRSEAGRNARLTAMEYPIERNVSEFLKLLEGV